MAWFVRSEYKDSDRGTYWSPDVAEIPEERVRFEAIGGLVRDRINADWLAGDRNMDSPDFPFGLRPVPALKEGWRWVVPDRPLREQLREDQDEICDIVTSHFDSYAISQKVIDIIESIEPGVHQYFPYELISTDGSVHPAKRWLLNVCTRAEVIDTDKSTIVWSRQSEPHRFGPPGNSRHLVAKADEASKRAVWCEWRYQGVGGKMLISDRFWDELQSQGCRGWSPEFSSFPDHVAEL